MKYIKEFESKNVVIVSYLKKFYVKDKDDDFTILQNEVKTLTDYKFDFELYYRLVDNEYVFNILVFITDYEYTKSKTLYFYNYKRYDTLNSKFRTPDIKIIKQYLNSLTDWIHINNKNDIETEITANKFNI